MRNHQSGLALIAVAAAVAVAAFPATAGVAASWNVPVHIKNSSCKLGYVSVSHQYTRIVFGIFNDGTVAHGFDVSAKFKSGLVKPHQERTLIANFGHAGAYRYACVAAHSTVKKGVFTVR